jgi:Mg-chelatase subunit ChlD
VAAVAFAERAAVLLEPERRGLPAAADLALGAEGTDIERGIYRALDLVPRDSQGRLVLFTDGHETEGDVRRAARLGRALGVDITTAPFSSRQGAVSFERSSIDLPRRAARGERFLLRLWIASSGAEDQDAVVEVVRDRDVPVSSSRIHLRAGKAQLIEMPYKIETRGLHCLEARIRRAAGSEPGPLLDEQLGFINITGPPRVLLIEPSPLLSAALRAGGGFEVVERSEAPRSFEELLAYEAVAICDRPLDRLGREDVEPLRRYVAEGAGGLLLAGGQSFIGETEAPLALDPLLPVVLESRKVLGQGAIDLIIIMDTSGSMTSAMGGGKTAIDIAFDAAVRVAGYLKTQDRLGVLFFAAGTAFTWVKPFGPVSPSDIALLRNCQRARCYKSGGGINVDEALAEAALRLPPSRERTQHMVLLSDASDSNFVHRSALQVSQEAARRKEQGSTLSVVGIEYHPRPKDRASLVALAAAGGGEYYGVGGAGSDIPNLVLEDLKGRERYVRFIDCPVRPRADAREDVFGKLGGKTLPPLSGYAVGSLKRGARGLFWADAR